MAQRLTNSFINTNRPGAYVDPKVKSQPVGTSTSGVIVLVGESDGGAATFGIDSTNGDLLKNNFYTPDQFDRVAAKYIKGSIVDAFKILSAPSGDANISGSARRIYIAKTNQGARASSVMPTTYGTLKDRNWGIDGNKNKYQITQSISEVASSVSGSVIGSFGVTLDAASFTVRVNGGAATLVSLGTGGHANIGALVTELDAALPAGISCEAIGATNALRIFQDPDASANTRGYGKSFELIDSTSGKLALLGHVIGMSVSSAEPEVQLDIIRQDTGVNESYLVDAEIALNIGYKGTTASLTVSDSVLTTTIAGGSGSSLSINLVDHATLSDLASYINSQTDYTCSVASSARQKSPVDLDNVTSAGICSTAASLLPGRIKRAAAKFFVAANQSPTLSFTATATLGLPTVMAVAVFLAGGLKGSTTAANIVAAVSDLEGINTNFIVPLFSRDASSDIADALTDSASTYTIDAIHALLKNHVLAMSTAKIKKHRSVINSFWGSFADSKSKATTMAHARVSMTMQKSTQVNSLGNTTNFMPWFTAVIAAGMQCGGFYKSITNKLANVISFEDPSGFDSGNVGDIETAIDAGLLFLEKAVVGSNWVVDQTTYGIDTNFVYNSLQAMYAADLVTLDLAASFHTAYTGKSLADVDAPSAYGFLASKMNAYKQQKLIVASADAPLGYLNDKIVFNGPIMEVKVEIKLSTAILFIPISLEFSQMSSAA